MVAVLCKKLAQESTRKRKPRRTDVDGDGVHRPQRTSQPYVPTGTGWGRSRMERSVVLDGAVGASLVRKRGRGNRGERPQADSGLLDGDELEFVMAVDNFKRANQVPFPRLTDYLFILRQLGWSKTSG